MLLVIILYIPTPIMDQIDELHEYMLYSGTLYYILACAGANDLPMLPKNTTWKEANANAMSWNYLTPTLLFHHR